MPAAQVEVMVGGVMGVEEEVDTPVHQVHQVGEGVEGALLPSSTRPLTLSSLPQGAAVAAAVAVTRIHAVVEAVGEGGRMALPRVEREVPQVVALTSPAPRVEIEGQQMVVGAVEVVGVRKMVAQEGAPLHATAVGEEVEAGIAMPQVEPSRMVAVLPQAVPQTQII